MADSIKSGSCKQWRGRNERKER